MSVRVRCKVCGEIATIQDSVVASGELKKLYCTCNNPECGMGFSLNLEFDRVLSPSALLMPPELRDKFARMNRKQQQELFSKLA
ncbi:ogr/Delta-like zinc finger family protein [Endozoicomonas lisbonensis]|uniref:Zinc finger Ogr/Delta-type domain-containing protein n=1 Tax=Endozoicomonas lisbonensis TaxID=3120522 RepID=A0ABV2SIR1_9GAMM